MKSDKPSKLKKIILGYGFKAIKAIPPVKKRIEREYEGIIRELENIAKPYRNRYPVFTSIPEQGLKKKEILKMVKELCEEEEKKWKEGYVSGAVYHGDEKHINFLNRIYALSSQSNPLHSDIWASTIKFEAEIISMTAEMLGAKNAEKIDGGIFKGKICGNVTSGGTESILLAMKTYRDWGRTIKGIKKPEIVVPVTAHAAFEKAANYFNIKIKKIPVDEKFMADVSKAERAITGNTVVLVGSAPGFPHGIIDPIKELSEIAREKEIGFHVDACLGGFILPWAKKLGYDIPPFDFSLPGVSSISADTHKYGFAAKGTSVILYRGEELRRFQYFKTTEWPGGLYFSPTIAGSRPGALSAECWAAMLSIGQKGYIKATKEILQTAEKIKKGIKEIPELRILGNPLWVIAFTSDKLDIYRIMDFMSERGWSLNGLHHPKAIHICVTLRHTPRGVVERFIKDLKEAVRYVKNHPHEKGKMAPVYGMAASFPDRTVIEELMEKYMDVLYRP